MAFKAVNDAMAYEKSPVKNNTKLGRKALIQSAEHLDSFALSRILVKRHKVGLLAVGNIILVLNWFIPEWPQIVLSLVK